MKITDRQALSLEDLDLVQGGMQWQGFRQSDNVEDRRDWTSMGVDGNTGNAYSMDGNGNVMEQNYDVGTGGWGDAHASNFDGPLVNDHAMDDVDWAGNAGDE